MSQNESQTMGKVLVNLTVTNQQDYANNRSGLISGDQVRSLALNNVLVDTGATLLCLPPNVVQKLGLSVLKEVIVETAAGLKTARIFENVRLSIEGREGTFDCLELPGGVNEVRSQKLFL